MRNLLQLLVLMISFYFFFGNKTVAQSIQGDSLIWQTTQLGFDTIALPTSGVYNIGNIDYTDQITYLSIKVIGANDTTRIPAIYDNDTIGYMVFDIIDSIWIFNLMPPVNILVGTNDVLLTFKDTALIPNTLTLTVRFITTDFILPSPDFLIWSTSDLGFDTINNPTAGIYDLGNIYYTDTINYLRLLINDYDLDTNDIVTTGSIISTVHYNSGEWIFQTIPHTYNVGQNNIFVKFQDFSGNDTTITIRFNILDTIFPVADTLKWTTTATGLHTVLPTNGIYNLASINESDQLTNLSIKINDFDIDTNAVTTSGTFALTFHNNGLNWVASNIPNPLPVGNDTLIAVFKDNSGNDTTLKIIFSIIDNVIPKGGRLIWETSNLGKDTINTPVSNVYNLGNICITDIFVSFNLKINESNIDTNKVPLILNVTPVDTIGWMNYNLANNDWICNITNDFPSFTSGQHNITAKFWDKATPTAHNVNLTIRFTTGTMPTVNLGKDSIICSDISITLNAGSGTGKAYLWSTGATTATFIANYANLGLGVHTIYVTVTQNGCSAEDSVKITIKQKPTVNVTPLTATVCSGTPVTLVASGATTYTWNNGAVYHGIGDTAIVTPNSTTTATISYTVTGTTNGCSSTKNSNITVKPTPNVGLGLDFSIPVDNNIYFGLTSGYNYLWSNGNTTSSLYIQGVDLIVGDTIIWVKATDPSNNCFKYDTIVITVTHKLAINNNSANDFVKIYPNPTSGIINLEIENLNNNSISVEIFDILGNKVYYKNFENYINFVESIDLSSQSKGIYLVKININGTEKINKLILY